MLHSGTAQPSNSEIGSEFYQKLANAAKDDLFNVVVRYQWPILGHLQVPADLGRVVLEESRDFTRRVYAEAKIKELMKRYGLEENYPAIFGYLPIFYFERNSPIRLTAAQIIDLDQNVGDILMISEAPADDKPYLIPRRTKEEIAQAFSHLNVRIIRVWLLKRRI